MAQVKKRPPGAAHRKLAADLKRLGAPRPAKFEITAHNRRASRLNRADRRARAAAVLGTSERSAFKRSVVKAHTSAGIACQKVRPKKLRLARERKERLK